jgi:hypothetical protein
MRQACDLWGSKHRLQEMDDLTILSTIVAAVEAYKNA